MKLFQLDVELLFLNRLFLLLKPIRIVVGFQNIAVMSSVIVDVPVPDVNRYPSICHALNTAMSQSPAPAVSAVTT
ncbi:MAG: hypothetical protein ACXU9J_04875 [Syntrophales bacterium]